MTNSLKRIFEKVIQKKQKKLPLSLSRNSFMAMLWAHAVQAKVLYMGCLTQIARKPNTPYPSLTHPTKRSCTKPCPNSAGISGRQSEQTLSSAHQHERETEVVHFKRNYIFEILCTCSINKVCKKTAFMCVQLLACMTWP